jgi:hypothetical protein
MHKQLGCLQFRGARRSAARRTQRTHLPLAAYVSVADVELPLPAALRRHGHIKTVAQLLLPRH